MPSQAQVVNQPGIEVGLCHGQKLWERETAKPVIEALRRKGIDISENTRTQLKMSMLKHFDEVILLAEKFEVPKVLRVTQNIHWWSLPDPDGQGADYIFEQVQQLEKKVKAFLDKDSGLF